MNSLEAYFSSFGSSPSLPHLQEAGNKKALKTINSQAVLIHLLAPGLPGWRVLIRCGAKGGRKGSRLGTRPGSLNLPQWPRWRGEGPCKPPVNLCLSLKVSLIPLRRGAENQLCACSVCMDVLICGPNMSCLRPAPLFICQTFLAHTRTHLLPRPPAAVSELALGPMRGWVYRQEHTHTLSSVPLW